MEIIIVRIGHRLPRDERISTHVALVSRAFGASSVIYSGQHDGSLESSVSRIVENWGARDCGNLGFSITYEKNYMKKLRELKKDGFCIVHLTMYGMPLPEKKDAIASNGKIAVVIGAEQVPREVYEIADFNIGITNQPHSEVAALAVFLNEINKGEPLTRAYSGKFAGGKIRIEPNERGKGITRL